MFLRHTILTAHCSLFSEKGMERWAFAAPSEKQGTANRVRDS